ncbi:MAG: prepilin-type N-terminal cleavage/methylation domain-containing protein [bacterium]
MKAKNKAGFTLIELMVVAIIVAILAAVAIPLMAANKKRAYATEAQAGCSAIKMALRVMQADAGMPTLSSVVPNGNIKGISGNDLDGTYFLTSDYKVTSTTTNFVIVVTGTKSPVSGETLTMTNDTANVSSFGGSLVQ